MKELTDMIKERVQEEKPKEKKVEKQEVKTVKKKDDRLIQRIPTSDGDESREKFREMFGTKQPNEEKTTQGLELKVNGKVMKDPKEIITWLKDNQNNLLKG
jgi:hypothetical protein